MPTFDPVVPAIAAESLGPLESLRALLPAVINLARSGDDGWRTLCQLAELVPVTTITHPSSQDLAEQLVTDGAPNENAAAQNEANRFSAPHLDEPLRTPTSGDDDPPDANDAHRTGSGSR